MLIAVHRLPAVLAASALLAVCASTAARAGEPAAAASAYQWKSCGVLHGVSRFGTVGVAVRDRFNGLEMSCRKARRLAALAVGGRRIAGWTCTGRGTRFGRCRERAAGPIGYIVRWSPPD